MDMDVLRHEWRHRLILLGATHDSPCSSAARTFGGRALRIIEWRRARCATDRQSLHDGNTDGYQRTGPVELELPWAKRRHDRQLHGITAAASPHHGHVRRGERRSDLDVAA